MNEREWKLGLQNVDELHEYKNLGVTKNYISSSVSNSNSEVMKSRPKGNDDIVCSIE